MSGSEKDRAIEGDDALLRLRPGAQLGRYELVAVVASGGMGRVWAARAIGQHGFRRLVALKTILPSFAAVPEFEQRFLDEARLASQIHHPNVCQIDDLGEANGILYMALEWIDGAPVSELYRESKGSPKKKPVDPRFAARIVAQVCAGLHAAHELKDDHGQSLGVVHRDVSPQNVLVGDGIVKVTDFGIAKALGRTLQTKAGEVRGKAPYLAPEQLTAHAVDRRTDVYAVGALLYEISTGLRAFDGETDAQILVKVMNEAPVPPGEVVPGYPPELQSIVLRALSKRPGMRFGSALEMQRALEHYLSTQDALTDGAMAKIVEDRLGAELHLRRELVKKGGSLSNVAASSPDLSPPSIRSADVLSDSDVLPIMATAPSAIDLAGVGPTKPPVPGKAPPIKKSATPTMPATPQAAFALSGRIDEVSQLGTSDVQSAAPSSLISAPMPLGAAPAPGFLDPDALRARRGGNAPPVSPANTPSHEPSASHNSGIELERVDLMAAAEELRHEYERSGPPPKKVVKIEEAPKKPWALIIGASVGAVVLLAVLAIVSLPKYVEFRLNNAVAAAGLGAKWSKVSVATSAITLQDVTLTVADIPGLVLTAKQVELTPTYAPSHAAIRGGSLVLAGPAADLQQHAQAWLLAHPSANDITNATLDELHVEWPHVFNDSRALRADGLHAEITHLSATNKLLASTPSLRLDGDHGSLGPWGVDVTVDGNGTVMHAALDPSVPQEAAISLTFPTNAPPSITAHVSRTPLSHLGVSPSLLGLAPTDETQLEIEAQLAGSPPSRMRGDVHLTLHDARTPAMPVPLDVVLVANVNGDADQPLPIHVTQLTLGPLRAQAETLLDVTNGGFRIDGKWNAQMPCARMADIASDAGFGLGTVTTPLGKLAKTADRTGEAQVSGLVTFDAHNLDRLRFAPTYAATCGIPLLTALAAP